MKQYVIFTDIDGTLIDFNTYTFDQTAETVAAVVERGIPLILCSSKTQTEQMALRAALGIPGPFIVENGSAIFIPGKTFDFEFPHRRIGDWRVIELGVPAAAIHDALAVARAETGLALEGFSDLDAAAVAHRTGLDLAAAERARQRDYSETIATPLTPDELARLRSSPAMHDLLVVSGGRFHTVTGRGAEKGAAVARLAALYRRQLGDIITLGVGDSANDRPLLAAVDRPFLVQKPDGSWEPMALPGLTRLEAIGPRGWRQMIDTLGIIS